MEPWHNARMRQIATASLGLFAAAALLGACQTIAPASQVAEETQAPAFVEAACGGCHAVEPPFLSPNPDAPSFAAIANRGDLTQDTLASWLRDAHNYPEVMDFDLKPEQAEDIAAYMATLRREEYRPES